jgi:heterodisulfide reductase subunit C
MAINEDFGKLKIESFMSFADNYLKEGLGTIPKEYHGQLKVDYGKHWENLQENLEEVRKQLGLDSMYLLPEAKESVDKTLDAIGFKKRVKEIKNVRNR